METQIHNIYKNIHNIQKKYKKDYIKIKRSNRSHNIKKFYKGDNVTRKIWKIMDKMAKITKYEKKEVMNSRSNKTYKILVADSNIKIKLFCAYLVIFAHRANLRSVYINNYNRKTHVGIDYEFNNREIALMQINLEDIKKSYIWLVNPDEFDNKQYDILIKSLMINKKIYKILHGPESLDIPYMYEKMFNSNKQDILDFTSKMFDTRYLCEYYKINRDEEHEKCTIYNALHYFGTINKKKLRYLEEGHEKMGLPQNVSWDIHDLDKYYLEYALYDVLYLQHHLLDIYRKISYKLPEYVNTYKYITSMMRFVFCERRDVTNISDKAKKETDPVNNYLVKSVTKGYKPKNMRLIEIYNEIMENFYINDQDVDIELMLSIGYFKKTISPLFKQIIYGIIFRRYDVYKTVGVKAEKRLSINRTYSSLRDNGYMTMHDLLHYFENEALNKMITLYR